MYLLERDETLFCHIFWTLKLSWDILHKTAITIVLVKGIWIWKAFGLLSLTHIVLILFIFQYYLPWTDRKPWRIERPTGEATMSKMFLPCQQEQIIPFLKTPVLMEFGLQWSQKKVTEVVSLFKKWQKMYQVYWFPLSYLVQTMAELWEPELFWPWQFIIQVGEKEQHC